MMPIETHEHHAAGDDGANSPSSTHSSQLSLISNFELMGGSGIERHVDARVALLTPASLTALISQLQIGQFCRESSSLGGGVAFTLRRRLRVIHLLSASIKIQSYSSIFGQLSATSSLLTNQMAMINASSGPLFEGGGCPCKASTRE